MKNYELTDLMLPYEKTQEMVDTQVGFQLSFFIKNYKLTDLMLPYDKTQKMVGTQYDISHFHIAVGKRLKSLGMIQKEGHWVPRKLKTRHIERRFFTCELLLQRQKRKGFLHRIVTGDGKPNIHGSKLQLCIWWDQRRIIYYELLKPHETVTGDLYRLQLMCLSHALNEKRLEYSERHEKVILLHDNTRPHVAKSVKTYLETLKREVLPHPPYSPDIAPSEYHLFRSMADSVCEQKFTSYEDCKKWVDSWISSIDEEFFRRGIRSLIERSSKVVESDGQYFN